MGGILLNPRVWAWVEAVRMERKGHTHTHEDANHKNSSTGDQINLRDNRMSAKSLKLSSLGKESDGLAGVGAGIGRQGNWEGMEKHSIGT